MCIEPFLKLNLVSRQQSKNYLNCDALSKHGRNSTYQFRVIIDRSAHRTDTCFDAAARQGAEA